MFRVQITDEDGSKVVDAESSSVVMVYDQDGGMAAQTLLNCGTEQMFHIAMVLDIVRDKLLKKNIVAMLMYKMRKHLVKRVDEIDISMLNALLERRMTEEGDDDNEED